jgi:hypothetical protein
MPGPRAGRRGRPLARAHPARSWPSGSSMVAVSAKVSASPQLEVAQRAGPGPVQAQDPGPDRPDRQREREDRCRSGLTRRRRERRPAGRGFQVGQVRGQRRADGGGRVQRRSFSEGQLQLGEPLADLVGHVHQVTRLRVPRGAQPGAGGLYRGHGRRACVPGRHPSAPQCRLLRDQSPDTAQPAMRHPCRRRSQPAAEPLPHTVALPARPCQRGRGGQERRVLPAGGCADGPAARPRRRRQSRPGPPCWTLEVVPAPADCVPGHPE